MHLGSVLHNDLLQFKKVIRPLSVAKQVSDYVLKTTLKSFLVTFFMNDKGDIE